MIFQKTPKKKQHKGTIGTIRKTLQKYNCVETERFTLLSPSGKIMFKKSSNFAMLTFDMTSLGQGELCPARGESHSVVKSLE